MPDFVKKFHVLRAVPIAIGLVVLGSTEPSALAHDPTADGTLTLFLYGPELPFMFPTSSPAKDFAWAELMAAGSTGIGTVAGGQREVLGVGGEFFIAEPDNPTPRPDEMTPSGAVITFEPDHTLSIKGPVDLETVQNALDAEFVDTDTFVFMFRAHGTLATVEYQLAGPRPGVSVIEGIESGESQKAVTIGTKVHRHQCTGDVNRSASAVLSEHGLRNSVSHALPPRRP